MKKQIALSFVFSLLFFLAVTVHGAEPQLTVDQLLLDYKNTEKKPDDDTGEKLDQLRKISQKILDLYPLGGKDYQLMLPQYLSVEQNESENFPKKMPLQKIRESETVLLKNLNHQFPKNIYWLELLGATQEKFIATNADRLDAIKTFANCLKLDAKDTKCRAPYNFLVTLYTSNSCEKLNKSLGFYLAKDQTNTNYSRKFILDDKTLFLEKNPSLKSDQIQNVNLKVNTSSMALSMSLQLSEAGQRSLADASDTNIGGKLAMTADDQILLTLPISEQIDTDLLEINPGPGKDVNLLLRKVCEVVLKLPNEAIVK